MEAELETLLEIITMNVGYPVSAQNLAILADHLFYFEICSLIFPQLNIKIIRINEEPALSPAQRLQKLLELLTEELQYNLAALSAPAILNGNLMHTYRLLIVLKQFSEAPPLHASQPKMKYHQRLRSHPPIYEHAQDQRHPQSARVHHKDPNLSVSVSSIDEEPRVQGGNQPIDEEQAPGNTQMGRSVLTVTQQGNFDKEGEIKQKKKDDGKNQAIGKNSKKIVKPLTARGGEAKDNKKYKSYLQNLMKPSKVKKQKEPKRKKVKSTNALSLKKQTINVQNIFASFECKIRDEKQKYLRKMHSLVRAQENQRMRVQQKMSVQKLKESVQRSRSIIASAKATHSTRLSILREQIDNSRQELALVRKQKERKLRESSRELKEQKKKQLKQIKGYISEMNNKILMKFEEGGELQKIVLALYKKL